MNLSQTLEASRNVLRFKHMAYKTEQSYLGWIRRYAYWCREHQGGSHEDKVRAFLTHLACDRTVSASTQNQALNAIVFLYKHVLNEDVGDFSGFHPARQPRRLPVVLYACPCACRTSTSHAASSPCAAAREPRTVPSCFRTAWRPAAWRAVWGMSLIDSLQMIEDAGTDEAPPWLHVRTLEYGQVATGFWQPEQTGVVDGVDLVDLGWVFRPVNGLDG